MDPLLLTILGCALLLVPILIANLFRLVYYRYQGDDHTAYEVWQEITTILAMEGIVAAAAFIAVVLA
jgi:hypothetical protein